MRLETRARRKLEKGGDWPSRQLQS